MELRMNYNYFIKLKNVTKINDISAEVIDYQYEQDELKGILGVAGSYYRPDTDEVTYPFNEEIPFEIMFTSEIFDISDVDCINLEYDLIEGRGVEVMFDISVNYEKSQNDTFVSEDEIIQAEELSNRAFESDLEKEELEQATTEDSSENARVSEDLSSEEITAAEVNEPEDLEIIKDEVSREIENKLSSTLLYKDDNLPSEESIVKIIGDKKRNIKICYYQKEEELEQVCREQNLSIDQVFKANRQNDLGNNRRIIITE